MRIIVSQPGKQYTDQLLAAISQRDWLEVFYSAFVTNKIFPQIPAGLTKPLRDGLKKRYFRHLSPQVVQHFPLLALREQLAKRWKAYEGHIYVLRQFDQQVAKKLGSVPYDLVVGYENGNLLSFQQARKDGKPTVLDLAQIHHEAIVDILAPIQGQSWAAFEREVVNPYKSEALQSTSYILTLSTFAKQSLIFRDVPEQKIYEVNLGVDHKRFQLQSNAKDPNRKLRFLFVGTLTRRKGLGLLLATWKKLALRHAELVLVGPMGDARDVLHAYDGFFTHIPFLHHEALVKEYQRADVFVFPSHLDSWAQTVIEAMACGTPVIVTENTGAKDAVQQGGGFVIPVDDAQALAEKIHYFYDNPTEIERMGREAHRVAQQYSWDNYHRQVVEALTDIWRREGLL